MKCFLPIYFAVILFAVIGCRYQNQKFENTKNTDLISLKYNSIRLDSVMLDSINSSYVGQASLYKKALYFIDVKFSFVYKFDENGKLQKRFVGQGRGKNELPIKTIMFFSFLPNGNSIFVGPSWDCFIYNSDFEKIDDYQINWHPDVTLEQMANRPDPSQPFMYSFNYSGDIKATDDKIYFPILSQFPKFNPTTPDYGPDARVLAQMDISTGYIDKVYGRFPPMYRTNFNALVFPYVSFDLDSNDNLLLTYPADPHIYITDDEFNIIESFGRPGRNMDTNYVNVNTFKNFTKNWQQQMEDRGYYTTIKYIPEKDLAFRSYTKGNGRSTDGLQIYKRDTLIADVDVPKNFKIIGYIAPYFYSNAVVNADKGQIKMYKFKL